ncbi:hypothetical protein [Rhizobium sp.]|uniref:hypothetical protein n=1 Tax=Rhizobium sp. TaxID=391 RepID=UPI0028A7D79B
MMKKRRLIKQTRPGQPLGGILVVFHWQRRYALANFHIAAEEKRAMTDAEIAADGEELPRYSFTAYRVPEGDEADLQKLRDLILPTGFQKQPGKSDWVAAEDGDDPAMRLKLALKAQGVDAVHYNEIPDVVLVPVSMGGQL